MAALLRRKLPILPSLLRRIRPFSALPEPVDHHSSPETKTPSSEPRPIHPLLQLQHSIRSESDPDRIANLFLSSMNLHRFHSSRPLFSLTVKKLVRSQRPDLVKGILELCLTDPNSPKSEGFLARILSLYSSAGLPDAAMEAFCSASPEARGEVSFSSLLQSFVHNGRYSEIKSIFERASSEFKLTPGVFSHNILINGLCESGELDEARKLLDEMSKGENGRPEPTIVSYNTMLWAYMKNDMEGPYDEILRDIREPNVVTMNCRIARFCKRGETLQAEQLLKDMGTEVIKIQPTVSTFYHIIHGYCQEGKVKDAMRMFKMMKFAKRRSGSDGVSPNADIYNILIRSSIEKERFNDALWVCLESLRRKSLPRFEDVKEIIEGLLKQDKFDEAKDLNERMRVMLVGEPKDAWEKMISGVSFEPVSG
ncbi:hypothetical protein LUZ60_014860 [Juncus effusus]|nr:hypothetical protein LUZ60_014860 [Juncus effusus]